tara:strand:- start:4812 stop:5075 length:264 start_codon:yes stop_codon:yes gene_type:complete
MKIGNDIHGYINGSIVNIDEVEIDLVVKALTLAKDEPMCDIHADMIDELTSQFEAMFKQMTKYSDKELDNQDEGWYNRGHDQETHYS